jgi:hypothetical protein
MQVIVVMTRKKIARLVIALPFLCVLLNTPFLKIMARCR